MINYYLTQGDQNNIREVLNALDTIHDITLQEGINIYKVKLQNYLNQNGPLQGNAIQTIMLSTAFLRLLLLRACDVNSETLQRLTELLERFSAIIDNPHNFTGYLQAASSSQNQGQGR